MNVNKIKKISVKFPNFIVKDNVEYEGKQLVLKLPEIQNINNRMYSKLFADSSTVHVGARYLPKVEGFNCTWRNDEKNPQFTIAQFTFASGEERKVMKIIEKYNGQIIPSREDLNQWEIEEFNQTNTGKENRIENVNERLS
jgi:hypothetical protein